MPVFKKAEFTGRVLELLAKTDDSESIESEVIERMPLSFAGIPDEAHEGETRRSCVRVKMIYDEGTEIANTRQLTLVSREEIEGIAADMEIPVIEPEWLGANLVLEGIPYLTLLPPSSRLRFESGATLVVDMLNEPCAFPAKVIESHHPKKGRFFVKTAGERRGITAWVEKEGEIAKGDRIEVFLPTQRAWPGNAV